MDPLTLDWVTVASRRMQRPVTDSAADCPFCPVPPGSSEALRQASEAPRDDYDVAVFGNRFPAFGGPAELPSGQQRPGYRRAPGAGAAEVVLYSPRHDDHLSTMDPARVRLLVDVWAQRTVELYQDPKVEYVFVFENRGAGIGQTIDHPHGQIYAYPFVPSRIGREVGVFSEHRSSQGTCLQCIIAEREAADGRRMVDQGGGWRAFVPFAPRFPFELHLVPEVHRGWLPDLSRSERSGLADLLQRTVLRYDRLVGREMEYMMCVYQRPQRCRPDNLWHLRVSFYPVRRGPDKLKFLAGSESGAGAFLTDATPEDMAERLRAAGS